MKDPITTLDNIKIPKNTINTIVTEIDIKNPIISFFRSLHSSKKCLDGVYFFI